MGKDFSQYTHYLFSQVPMFQNIGTGAYKEGLANTLIMDEHFGHPHHRFHTIHVAGTNGKGSCSHTIASILQEAGYRVGLFTSPHLVDFRERIRVNGKKVSKQYVMNFIDTERVFFEPLHPTFFELTTAMAFKYFAEKDVDVAIIEVGLGGRLDCTNIIIPDLSIITNISFDHTELLGNTLGQIAHEKSGIIKPGVPVVIGEVTIETRPVFLAEAKAQDAPICFAEEYSGDKSYEFELKGACQVKNKQTILCAVSKLIEIGYAISEEHIRHGLLHVTRNTGLMGRWQTLRQKPKVICDTGHNVGGMAYVAKQLRDEKCKRLRIVIGMVSDKDVNGVLALMPHDATYYFCQASVRRSMSSIELAELAQKNRLFGKTFSTVDEAFDSALTEADRSDLVFVGGSSYVVADLMCYIEKKRRISTIDAK